MKKKIDWLRLLNDFVLVSLIIAIITVSVVIVFAPAMPSTDSPFKRLKTDYILMLLECILGVFAMLLPKFLRQKVNLRIPSAMMLLYTIFLYCSIYLGEVRSFYYQVPHWDTILHTFSGAMLGALGFSIITILNRTEKVPVNLSPAFVAVFAFCFALSLGTIWEFYEFIADGILKTNMQKYALETGELLVGRAALTDTMKDLIVDSIGAIVISVIGYISIRDKKGWVEKILLKKEKIKEEKSGKI